MTAHSSPCPDDKSFHQESAFKIPKTHKNQRGNRDCVSLLLQDFLPGTRFGILLRVYPP